MKTMLRTANIFFVIAAIAFTLTSCNKNASSGSTSATTTTATTSATSATIAVAASTSSSDSVYVLQQCNKGQYRDSIDAANLPGSVTAYLTSNYSGYTFEKGFTIKDSTGTIHGYVVIILYNNKPVGLLFDAAGSFVKVLEQRQPGDMHGPGWHNGGLFCNRDGKHRDTVALADLPSAIIAYVANNYPGDTLLKAFKTADSSYLLISKDNGLYATLFGSDGSFIKRVQLPEPGGKPQPVAEADLPANVLTYLSTTYPAYVFDRAFSATINGMLQGYLVIIDANNTKYAVQFDAVGNFVAAIVVW